MRREARFVGFDLDGTLYKSTPEINDRVRVRIAERILEKMPELGDVKKAREEFERRYAELESGAKVLNSVGYNNSREVMNECVATADVVDLIPEDPALVGILNQIKNAYERVYLITSSPKESGEIKLRKIGINPCYFDEAIFGEDDFSKSDGSAFKEMFRRMKDYEPFNYIYVGDRAEADIIPARKLGIRAISVWSAVGEAYFSLNHIHNIKGALLDGR